MVKKMIVLALIATFALTTFAAVDAMAKGDKSGYSQHGYKKADMESKLYKKLYFIMKNQDGIGISDAQVDKVMALKLKTKKDLIMKKAEIDVLALDIKAAMCEDEIDLNAVNALIDKKYDLKKAKTKAIVAASVELKKIITDDQMDKMKDLIKAQCEKSKRN